MQVGRAYEFSGIAGIGDDVDDASVLNVSSPKTSKAV